MSSEIIRRPAALKSEDAYYLSQLAGGTGASVNGTREFWVLRELALAKLALLIE